MEPGDGATGFENVRITSVSAHDNGYAGITTYGPTDPANVWYPHQNIYVGNCSAYNNLGVAGSNGASGSGIAISGANGVTIERSFAFGNGTNNTWSSGPVGIWAYDSTNVTIQYNESHHNHTQGTADGGGFDLDGGVSNSLLQYNYSHDNDGPGLLVTQYANARPQQNNTVRYNISQNDARKNGLGGITVYNGGRGISNEEIFNNTIFISGATVAPWAVQILDATTNVHLRNNIFFTSAGASQVYVAPGQTGILFQGNDYWTGSTAVSIYWAYSYYSTLSSWRLATGQEIVNGQPSGMAMNPQLTSAGGGGTIDNSNQLNLLTAYQLSNGSQALYMGLNLKSLFGIAMGSNDFYGTVIPQSGGYSLGAAEL